MRVRWCFTPYGGPAALDAFAGHVGELEAWSKEGNPSSRAAESWLIRWGTRMIKCAARSRNDSLGPDRRLPELALDIYAAAYDDPGALDCGPVPDLRIPRPA